MRHLLAMCLSLSIIVSSAQDIQGIVTDRSTQEPLAYVRIGIPDKNTGTISRDDGSFILARTQLTDRDTLVFSMVGYESQRVRVSDLQQDKNVIRLTSAIYTLNEVTVSADEIVELKTLGRPKATKTTIGHSGTGEWGNGGEWGVEIKNNGDELALQKIAFHTRFNTMDSILFRLNIYRLDSDLPGNSILQKEIYVTSRKRDKWITADVKDLKLIITGNIVVTMEIIRLWPSKTGDNALFFTYGEDPEKLKTYARESSFSPWLINTRPPLALYVVARKLNID